MRKNIYNLVRKANPIDVWRCFGGAPVSPIFMINFDTGVATPGQVPVGIAHQHALHTARQCVQWHGAVSCPPQPVWPVGHWVGKALGGGGRLWSDSATMVVHPPSESQNSRCAKIQIIQIIQKEWKSCNLHHSLLVSPNKRSERSLENKSKVQHQLFDTKSNTTTLEHPP